MGWWSFVPKPRGCPDPCLAFSLDVLEGSLGVRVNPPKCGPGVTQSVTQFSRSVDEHATRRARTDDSRFKRTFRAYCVRAHLPSPSPRRAVLAFGHLPTLCSD